MRLACLALVAVAAPASAGSAETGGVHGQVRLIANGKPVTDAGGVLVWVVGFEEPPPAEIPELRQRGRQFQPAVLAVTAGQSVSFPNADPFFHNVFSLSPARRFDLGQFKTGETKEKTFPQPGVVEVYCNIHPEMAATILVLPNRRHATTGADGSFAIDGIPPGTWSLYAYHPLAERPASVKVTVAGGKTVEGLVIDVDESRPRAAHRNKYGEAYGGQ